jgi:hypothetical protein
MWHYLETLGNLPRFFAMHPLTKDERLRALLSPLLVFLQEWESRA